MIDIKFDRVSKRYRVRNAMPPSSSRFVRMLRRPAATDFWAVRDVSFDVSRSETLGIIGHNGAGKSTLLKLLSRITAPTGGEITLNGRLAALIEVGSGFHPELTGRENVFLSGSILGMRRKEIAAKLDRIVAFSGVGAFIDTPVKWYSSGMYVRLGFAIAAHLDPDILLVDEVLGVGDAAFQLQCQERLNELRRGGTTMLFISHDLSSIEKLCDRVVLMEAGQLVASGAPRQVVLEYQARAAAQVAAVADASPAGPAAAARITAVTFHDTQGDEILSASTGGPLLTRVRYEVAQPIDDAVVEVFYYSRDGRILHCQQSTAVTGESTLLLGRGSGALEFIMPELGLQPDIYAIGATIRERDSASTVDWFYGRTQLYVEPGKFVRGYFYTPHEWRQLETPSDARPDGRRPHV